MNIAGRDNFKISTKSFILPDLNRADYTKGSSIVNLRKSNRGIREYIEPIHFLQCTDFLHMFFILKLFFYMDGYFRSSGK